MALEAGHDPSLPRDHMNPIKRIRECTEGTRVCVIEHINHWLYDHRQPWKRRVLWLHGPAGAGKSVIARTMAARCHRRKKLAASFFFSSTVSQETRSTRYVVSTLAYQIFSQFTQPELRRVAERAFANINLDSDIFNGDLKTQLEALILKPFRESELDTTQFSSIPELIIIDGVDDVGLGQPQDIKEQNDLLSALLWAARDPHFPFRLLIASRPNNSIREALSKGAPNAMLEIDLKLERYKSRDDIMKFLDSEFKDIQALHYPGATCRSVWPSTEEFNQLVGNSSGHFAYPAAVIRYVRQKELDDGAPDTDNSPEARLKLVLSWRPNSTPDGTGCISNPFEHLHLVYAGIIKKCISGSGSVKVHWMRAISRRPGSPAWFWRRFLPSDSGTSVDHQVRQAEQGLESLMFIPAQHQEEDPYLFFDDSLKDFVEDRSVSVLLGLGDDEANFPQFLQERLIQALKSKLCTIMLCLNVGLTPGQDTELQDFGSKITRTNLLTKRTRSLSFSSSPRWSSFYLPSKTPCARTWTSPHAICSGGRLNSSITSASRQRLIDSSNSYTLP